MNSSLYDVVIIGSGPAGLSAAIYAARAELNVVIVEKEAISGGQILNTYEVDNYPGLPGISGYDLGTKFREHCDKFGVEHLLDEVIKLEVNDENKMVYLESGEVLVTKTIIIATGAKNRKLGIPGEEELSGMGVSYCATCDGAFFKNKTVAVVGGGDVAVEDAIFLSRLCKKVYVIHRRNEFRATKTLSTCLAGQDNVEVLWNQTVVCIEGEDIVRSVQLEDTKTKEKSQVFVDGVFIAVGTIPNSGIAKNIVSLDPSRYIIADESCRTNVEGVFAAGDVRTKQLRQVVTAVADGANAVTSIEDYFIHIK